MEREREAAITSTSPIDERLVRFAILVANEVVPFKRHYAYLQWQNEARLAECRWDYVHGVRPASALPSSGKLRQYREIYVQNFLKKRKSHVVIDGPDLEGRVSHLCCVPIYLPKEVKGYLAVRRPRPFSHQEVRHMREISYLLQLAHADKRVDGLLWRLRMNLLEGHTFLQDLDAKSILDEYLTKVALVCHDTPIRSSRFLTECGVVRATAKLAIPNRTSLRIESCFSSKRAQWTRPKRQTVYSLLEIDSIASEVFTTSHPILSLDYQNNPMAKRLFEDTRSHMSVPIVAGHMQCLGVLSVESTKANAYDKATLLAFSILASHLAWPLERRLAKDRAKLRLGESKILAGALRDLMDCSSIERMRELTKARLQSLGYARGLFCDVDHHAKRVTGVESWGGDAMVRVAKNTKRIFKVHHRDCQIIAVTKNDPVLVSNPQLDDRVNVDALDLGHLRPFGIFPVSDLHGTVLMTLHVEREDGMPLGRTDAELLCEFASGLSQALERARHRSIAADWVSALLTSSMEDTRKLFKAFASFIVSNNIASRCRVYTVTKGGRQVALCQAGVHQVREFQTGIFYLNQRCSAILDRLKSTRKLHLVFRPGNVRDIPPSDDIYRTSTAKKVEHETFLKKRDVMEWVEVPIIVDEKVAAKATFDHKGQIESCFTVGELHLLATLATVTSLAAESVLNRHLYSCLCREGAVGSLLRHRLFGQFDSLQQELGNPLMKRQLRSALKGVRKLDSIFPSSEKMHKSTSLQEEIQLARKLIASSLISPAKVAVKLKIVGKRLDCRLANSHYTLCLILLVLLENAIQAIHSHKGQNREIIVETTEIEKSKICVSVKNWGSALPNEVIKAFSGPPRLLGGRPQHGKGLAFSRQLAHTNGWALEIDEIQNPTVFQLILPSKPSSIKRSPGTIY